MLTSAEATRNIWRSSTSFMPTISREAAIPRKSRFAERRACAHLFSASWFHFMRWPRSVVLVGATGKVCTVSWRTFRKWNDSRVVLEHHYDHQQSGEPLSEVTLGPICLSLPQVFTSRREY